MREEMTCGLGYGLWDGASADLPLNDQRIAIDIMIMTSLPCSHSASQSRSCWENGTVLTNKVIYHFVAHADELIMFRCYR
jgi:hypothetical protein